MISKIITSQCLAHKFAQVCTDFHLTYIMIFSFFFLVFNLSPPTGDSTYRVKLSGKLVVHTLTPSPLHIFQLFISFLICFLHSFPIPFLFFLSLVLSHWLQLHFSMLTRQTQVPNLIFFARSHH